MLDAEQSHHVTQVLRLRAGDPLALFDGRGREWDGRIVEAGRGGTTVLVGAERSEPVECALPVTLYQGVCRPDRMEWVIQKGVELGVAAIRPVATERSEGDLPSPDRLERWGRIAREAARQSGRRFVPPIVPTERLPVELPGRAVVALAMAPAAAPLAGFLTGAPPAAVWLLVGPEGGLDDGELEALAAGGWRPAGLGPRILRTETAGIVACALVLAAWGDLGPSVPPAPADPGASRPDREV